MQIKIKIIFGMAKPLHTTQILTLNILFSYFNVPNQMLKYTSNCVKEYIYTVSVWPPEGSRIND